MLTRKTQYAWMAVGGLICLFGLVLACKLRDGNKAIAQSDKAGSLLPPIAEPPLPPPPISKEPTPSFPPLDLKTAEEDPKDNKDKSPDAKPSSKSMPKAVLDMPLPMPPSSPPPPSPSPSSSVLPASFGPNTPAPKSEKRDQKKPESNFFFRKPSAEKKTDSADSVSVPMSTPLAPPSLPNEKMDKKPTPPPLGSAPPSPAPPPPPLPGSDPLRGSEPPVAPTSYAPVSPAPPSAGHDADHEAKMQPGEPPLAPAPGPVQLYHTHGPETLQDIARRTLGSSDRWTELHKLNPTLKPDAPLNAGTTVRLPADACVQADDAEPVKPLPALRPKPMPAKAKTLPLTGTYQCSLDDKGQLTLPRALRDQFGGTDTVLLSPGPDKCLWRFHSLEDRMVKQALRDRSLWEVLTRKPVQAGEEEVRNNPRARSAKLRAARRQGTAEARTNYTRRGKN